MPDLSLNVRGKDDGASAVLNSTADSLGSVKVAAGAAAAAFVAFSKESVKAFEEQARADRQLEAAAGDLAGAFKEQASAFQTTLGVSDDMVQQMQTLLLRFGEAPSQVQATTKALLDYAAFTGTDALSATKTLTSSVESGRSAFKELGISYDTTGSKSKDLAAATAALAAKVGGTAEAEAGSLTGSVAKASQQMGELQESWGKLVAEFITKTGVVDSARWAIEALSTAVNGGSDQSRRENLVDKLFEAQRLMRENADMANSPEWTSRRQFEGWKKSAEDAEAAIAKMDAAAKKVAVLPTTPLGGGDDLTKKGREDQKKARDAAQKDAEEAADKRRKIAWEETRIGEEEADKRLELWAKEAEALQKHEDEIGQAEADRRVQQEVFRQHELEAQKKHAEEVAKLADAALKKEQDSLRHQETMYAAAGAAIGGALISSLSSALEGAIGGEEQDPTEVFGNVLASILGVAGSVLGNVLLPGAGGVIGGALGGLAGAGIRAATRRRHDGGWVDAPRYHGGAWVGTDEQPAILQSGERVLSRADVASMGGPRGVDAAVRGGRGGGVNVYVSTLDGGTTADFFARNGVSAMLKNYRLNRGQSAMLFGGAT